MGLDLLDCQVVPGYKELWIMTETVIRYRENYRMIIIIIDK
jgi:hypothetical protein